MIPRSLSLWIVQHPRLILIGAAIITTIALLSAMQLTPNVSLRAMLADDAPSAVALDRIAEHFHSMDELLLVASLPVGTAEIHEDTAPELLNFANRLQDHINRSPNLRNIVAGFSYGIDESSPQRAYWQDVIIPNMLLHLDDAGFEAAIERLSLSSMREQISRNEVMIAAPGPAADLIARQLLRDPLRLREMISYAGPTFLSDNGHFLSADGSSLLIRITATQPSSDLIFSDNFLSAIQVAANQVNEDGLTLEYTGSYAIADASHRAIRRDMIRSVIGSLVLIQLFLLLVYRRLLSFVLAVAPVAIAIVTAFGVFSLLISHVTPVTAVIGGVLAGLGIDYCVHVLSHYELSRRGGTQPTDAAASAIRHVGPRITAAAATTMIGFLAISFSHVNALREFSLIGVLGLAAALGASLTILPAMLVMSDRRVPHRQCESVNQQSLTSLINFLCNRRSVCLMASAVVFAASALVPVLMPGSGLVFEADLASMHPQPNPALKLQQRINREFTGGGEVWLVHLQAESQEQLVSLSHDVAKRLREPAARDSGVMGVLSLADLVPDAAAAVSRREQLQLIDPDIVVHDFETALNESVFDPSAFAGYADFLRDLVRPHVVNLAELHVYPSVAQSFLPRHTTGSGSNVYEGVAIVQLAGSPADRVERNDVITIIRHVLGDLSEQTTLTGMSVVGHDTERFIRRDLGVLLVVAAAAVLMFLLILFRNPADVALTLLPTIFGLAILVAVMNLVPGGQGFNMINLIALPLLCGIGVDDGIFMVTIARRYRGSPPVELASHLRASTHAVIVTSLTTMLAFGSLTFTSMPAMQSLGWMTAVGVGACLVGTLGLLVPLLMIRSARVVIE